MKASYWDWSHLRWRASSAKLPQCHVKYNQLFGARAQVIGSRLIGAWRWLIWHWFFEDFLKVLWSFWSLRRTNLSFVLSPSIKQSHEGCLKCSSVKTHGRQIQNVFFIKFCCQEISTFLMNTGKQWKNNEWQFFYCITRRTIANINQRWEPLFITDSRSVHEKWKILWSACNE